MPDIPLSYRAKNSTVTEFKELVDERIGKNTESGKLGKSGESGIKSISDSILGTGTSSNTQEETELDKALYDRALSLPEAKTVSLKYTSAASKHQYGTFKGGQVYVNYVGNVNTDYKNVPKQEGWLTLNRDSFIYALFSNNDNDYIIRISDFKPKSIVEDFQPLYDKLLDLKYANEDTVEDDTGSASSKATTHRDQTSEHLVDESDQKDAIDADRYSTKFDDNIIQAEAAQNFFYGIYPRQIGKGPSDTTKNDSVYNNIQAVVYDLPGYGINTDTASLDRSYHQLFCYQQPDSVSYTAAAQYDSPTPRGAQQPFQFYNNANAMSLSFTLRWHIDEIRTLAKDGQRSYTIQELADIAEGFTRPWDVHPDNESNESLQPKLCKVILPGVSQIGYISEAQINFSGDMSGDYSTGGGVLTGSQGNLQERAITNYFYSQLEVAFTMIIVKDISLTPLSSTSLGVKMVLADNSTKDIKPNAQTTYSDTYKKKEEEPVNTVTSYEPVDQNRATAMYPYSPLDQTYVSADAMMADTGEEALCCYDDTPLPEGAVASGGRRHVSAGSHR